MSAEDLVHCGVLADQPDPLTDRRAVGDVDPGDPGGATVVTGEGGQDPDGGGLPGAVGPEEAMDRPWCDGEGEAVECALVAVGFDEVEGMKGRGWCSIHPKLLTVFGLEGLFNVHRSEYGVNHG